jgi:hypothetical protein
LKAFDRELDELEETIVYLALVFLVSSILNNFVGRFIGIVSFFASLACSLSLLAGFVAILLWVLRRFGSPLYSRLRKPELSRLQSPSINPEHSKISHQDR